RARRLYCAATSINKGYSPKNAVNLRPYSAPGRTLRASGRAWSGSGVRVIHKCRCGNPAASALQMLELPGDILPVVGVGQGILGAGDAGPGRGEFRVERDVRFLARRHVLLG